MLWEPKNKRPHRWLRAHWSDPSSKGENPTPVSLDGGQPGSTCKWLAALGELKQYCPQGQQPFLLPTCRHGEGWGTSINRAALGGGETRKGPEADGHLLPCPPWAGNTEISLVPARDSSCDQNLQLQKQAQLGKINLGVGAGHTPHWGMCHADFELNCPCSQKSCKDSREGQQHFTQPWPSQQSMSRKDTPDSGLCLTLLHQTAPPSRGT